MSLKGLVFEGLEGSNGEFLCKKRRKGTLWKLKNQRFWQDTLIKVCLKMRRENYPHNQVIEIKFNFY